MFRRVCLTISFLVFFIAPAWAQKQLVDRVVAVVNDEAITQSELDLYLRPLYEEFRKVYEGPELMRQLNEARLKLLKQMIEDRLVFQQAKAQNLEADESEVERMMQEFKDRFSSLEEMEKALVSEGFTLSKLRDRYTKQLLIRKLQDIEVRSRVVVSPREIEDYYRKHQSEFAEEAKVRVLSITVRQSEEAREKGLPDEAARKKIDEIQKRILAGENFELLARQFSEDDHAKEDGNIGWVKKGELMPVIDEAIFGMEPGQISSIIETPQGYHLFKVAEKKTNRVPRLEEIRDRIRMQVFNEKAQQRFAEWMDELKRHAYISIR